MNLSNINYPVLAIDVGGSSIKLGLVDGDRILARRVIPSNASEGMKPALTRIAEHFPGLCREANMEPDVCRGMGMGMPCIVDSRENTIISTPVGKYDDAPDINYVQWAKDAFDLPVQLDNDAHAALLGEWQCGAGKGCDNLVMLTLGTGVGSSVLINGRPLRGCHYQAGLLGGFTILNSGGRPMPNSAPGAAEAETGSWALPALAQDHPAFAQSALARLDTIAYKDVFKWADKGDEVARYLRDRSLTLWGDLVINTIHFFDPERVIIGGAVSNAADVIIPWIQKQVDDYAWTPSARVEVVAAQYPEDAGLLGAATLATQQLIWI